MSVLRSLLTAGVLASGLLWSLNGITATPAAQASDDRYEVTQQRNPDAACLDCHKPDTEGMHGKHASVINPNNKLPVTCTNCHGQPYTPTGKAKIERWFRTMKDQWMAALDMRDFHSLEELRGSLYAFVQQYNQSPHSSLRGLSPQDRFFSEPEQIRRLSEEDIHQNFLLEIERRVSADSVIVIDQIEYEVDYRFARQRIRLRYSPDMKEIFIVEADGTLTPLRLLNKTENALIKREKVRLCKGDE